MRAQTTRNTPPLHTPIPGHAAAAHLPLSHRYPPPVTAPASLPAPPPILAPVDAAPCPPVAHLPTRKLGAKSMVADPKIGSVFRHQNWVRFPNPVAPFSGPRKVSIFLARYRNRKKSYEKRGPFSEPKNRVGTRKRGPFFDPENKAAYP